MFRRPFKRRNDGSIEVRLTGHERYLLKSWATQLRDLLDDPDHIPALHRLSPPAYSEDIVHEAEYQAFMGSELLSSRSDALDRLLATTGTERLTESEAIAWMQSINAIRLVLGTHLGISDDTDEAPAADESGLYPSYQVLSIFLEGLVEAMSPGR